MTQMGRVNSLRLFSAPAHAWAPHTESNGMDLERKTMRRQEWERERRGRRAGEAGQTLEMSAIPNRNDPRSEIT